MTDTTANLGTIWVVGQRRRPGGSFPSGSGGGGGIPGDDGGVHQDEVDPDGGGPDGPMMDPCSDPGTALEWNADAAAAAAAEEFARQAAARTPPEDLNTREWGAYLYRNPDGSVRFGPVSFGPPFTFGGNGTVTLVQGGSMSDVVGFVHSHNSGGHLPSDGHPGAPGDLQVLDSLITASGNPSIRMYIVAPNQGPAGHVPRNQINVYDSTNARSARDSFSPGPEVNPEAQPCPA
jgi:hypothetical protein